MNTDDNALHGLDRAQLIKLGAAALLAAVGAGATEGEADAAAHAMVTNTGIPLGLDYQSSGFGKHATRQHTRTGKELKRVRITTNKAALAGATITHEMDNAESVGMDEDGHRHSHQFRDRPVYVGLWIE
jgi:hypothetical protein